MMKRRKLYISGPISNDPDYKTKFESVATELKGKYEILSPLFIQAALNWEEYMEIDIAMVKVCDVIYMMKNWEQSKGATVEHAMAQALGKEIIYQ